MTGIYKIINPKGKIYIGQSINIEHRFKRYKNMLDCNGQLKLYRSFIKYGVENHEFVIIEKCNKNILNERERYWQEFYNVIGDLGLNLRLVNTKTKNSLHTEETKKKISKAHKGRKHTEKSKRNMSLAKIGCVAHNKGKDSRIIKICSFCGKEYKTYNKKSHLCSVNCRTKNMKHKFKKNWNEL